MTTSPNAGRLFLGIALPADVRSALERHLRTALGGEALSGRPVPPANWHLTLRFLGDTTPAQLDELRRTLTGTPFGSGFDLTFSAPGAFPRASRATVLWLGVEAEPRLNEVAQHAEEVAVRAGLAPERRPFSAHLTLSRIRPPRDVRPLLARIPPFPVSFAVREVVVFRSHLGKGPVRYGVVERVALG